MSNLGALAYSRNAPVTGAGTLEAGLDLPQTLPATGDRASIGVVVEKTLAYSQAPLEIPAEPYAADINARLTAVTATVGGHPGEGNAPGPLPHYENPFPANAQEVKTVEQSTGAVLSMWA